MSGSLGGLISPVAFGAPTILDPGGAMTLKALGMDKKKEKELEQPLQQQQEAPALQSLSAEPPPAYTPLEEARIAGQITRATKEARRRAGRPAATALSDNREKLG